MAEHQQHPLRDRNRDRPWALRLGRTSRRCPRIAPAPALTPRISTELPPQSPATLLTALRAAATDAELIRRPRMAPERSAAFVARKLRLLSIVLEDMAECSEAVDAEDTAAWLREVLVCVQKSAAMLRERSRLWAVVNCDSVAEKWVALERELGGAVARAPVAKLRLSDDVGEMLALMARRPRRSSGRVFEDGGHQWRLRKELLDVLRCFERGGGPPEDGVLRNVLGRLDVRGAADCRDEDRRLRDELAVMGANADDSDCAETVRSLIGLVAYAERAVFGEESLEIPEAAVDLAPGEIPAEFLCPISRSIMRDPVMLSTGESFDRRCIEAWAAGAAEIVPNYALRSCIQQWCRENSSSVEADWEFSSDESDGSGDQDSRTAEFLVGKLATGPPDVQAQAAGELRVLARTGSRNRLRISEAGAVPFLVELLASGGTNPQAQENAVTALLNLAIHDKNKRLIAGAQGAIDGIVEVVRRGATSAARENGAAALYVLTTADDAARAAVAARPAAVPALVALLTEGGAQAKRDALSALLSLSVHGPNKAVVAGAGGVTAAATALLCGSEGCMEEAVELVASLAETADGARAVADDAAVMAAVAGALGAGTARMQEAACAVICSVGRSGGDAGVRALADAAPLCVPMLTKLAAPSGGAPAGARRKAAAALKVLNAAPRSSCFCTM